MGQPDYRIHELNRRLQQRTEVTHTKYVCIMVGCICIYNILRCWIYLGKF